MEDSFDTALGLMLHWTILYAKKAVRCDIFGRFSNLDKCWSEAAGDVIAGIALDYVGMDVYASLVIIS